LAYILFLGVTGSSKKSHLLFDTVFDLDLDDLMNRQMREKFGIIPENVTFLGTTENGI